MQMKGFKYWSVLFSLSLPPSLSYLCVRVWVCGENRENTEEVSKGHLAMARTPPITTWTESQLAKQQAMKVGQTKSE